MKEIVNSNLLKMILDNAASVAGSEDNYATAEKIMVVTIEHVEKYGDMGQDSVFVKLIQNTGVAPSVMRSSLLKHIKEHPVASLADKIYMQKIMLAAKNKVVARDGDMITLSDVIECIFADPSGAIKRCFTAVEEEGFDEPLIPDYFPKEPEDILLGNVTVDEMISERSKPKNTKMWLEALVSRVKSIRTILLDSVFGQDNAVSTFATGFFQAEMLAMTDKSRVRPGATFLFAGPPGVGKTFLAEKAAEALGRPFMRFDMSEYADKEANIEFCGSDKVYKNGKAGNVTSFVDENPQCVLLFDEIEKAHINVIHLFLQMLDAGRLRDNFTDEEVSFSQAILIFTTNAGRQLYENSESSDFSGVSRKVILKALQKDVNPETGVPYFPAAICSRFASGNVVMFNKMASHNLRDIAKREVLRHAGNFEKEIGIKVDIDEKVFTALLFAEGGAADARTVRSRAETFFDDELFELFRLVSDDNELGKISGLERISMEVALPENDDIRALFENTENREVLVFGDKLNGQRNVAAVQNMAEGKELLSKHDIQVIIIDPLFGAPENSGEYLNLEDVQSASREFFKFVRENYRDIPVYLVQDADNLLGDETLLSYTKLGVRGVINASEGAEKIEIICDKMHQQRSMNMLAKANKLVTFETAQYLTDSGRTAVIKLFDFEMDVAIDPEDGQSVLSGMSKPNVKFDDIIGAAEAKKELQYFVEYLKNPKKFLGTGVKPPKGVLLYGPPGTGKTMLAKAMASESDVTFIAAEGNQFLKKFVGEGSDKVHELFRAARKYAPAILFVDEIDAIAKERRGGEHGAGSEETLTAFLTEMDGFKNDPSKPVFVLAATNFDVEPGKAKSLDPALMRRFDRRVYVDLPDRDDRTKYIKMQMAKNEAFVVSDGEIDNIAMRSAGMSLAELESVLELALRTAIRSGDFKVTDEIFEDAFETFNSGEEKAWDVSQLERVARHEAGHAIICWHSGECPSYLTIVARGDHGGYMQHADNEGKAIYTKDELLAKIRTSLGGRASEIVYYGEKDGISTGASGELEAATRTAQHIICTYGMDEAFGLAVIDPQTARTGELSAEVRAAVNKMLDAEMKQAIDLITENKAVIDALIAELMKKNHLGGKEIDAILSKKAN